MIDPAARLAVPAALSGQRLFVPSRGPLWPGRAFGGIVAALALRRAILERT